MKSLLAPALLISLMCSQAFAQPATMAAPASQQGPQGALAPQNTQSPAPPTTSQASNTAAENQSDYWQCSLFATRYDWWKLELVVTTLSTYRLQNCGPDGMARITTASAAAQLKPVATFDTVLKGVPHQTLMSINLTPVVNEYFWVSNLKFSVVGETRLSLVKLFQATRLKGTKNLAGSSYVPFVIRGDAHYIWNAGTLAHRLVSPNGDAYIMYAYTRGVQPSLTRENLSSINQILKLPTGWTYENYFLDTTVVVRAGIENDNSVTVIFDDLSNFYVLYK